MANCIHLNALFLIKCVVFISVFCSCSCLPKTNTTQSNATTTATALTINKFELESQSCRYAPGLVVGNLVRVEECCARAVRNYERRWSQGGRRLTTYLENLRSWKCPQFYEECKRRLFSFNEFTRLVYDHFCNYTSFIDQCFEKINNTVAKSKTKKPLLSQVVSSHTKESNTPYYKNNSDEWKGLIKSLHSTYLDFEELLIPCVQVALYEADEEHLGEYHEIVRVNLPSCEITWCGYDGDTLRERMISIWTCMSNSCRAKMISIMVICGLLGLVITVVNSVVIVVYVQNPSLLHSQGIYKVSLALADLLVGVIVFPSFIGSLSRIMLSRHEHGEDFRNVSGFPVDNGIINGNLTTVQIREPAGQFEDFFPTSYLNAIGFFTVLSLTVSVYTLTVAGCDRLSAIYRPLSYHKERAIYYAKRLCIGLWLVGVLFSILPFFVEEIEYSLVFSILVVSGEDSALIVYAVAFVIPLVLMWIINGVTLHFTKKHAKVRKHLNDESKKKTHSIETRLTKTLSIMVGAFSLSVVPAAIVLIASFFSPSVHVNRPRQLKVTDVVVYNTFEFICAIALSCNSLWNFFIYSARNNEFRHTIRKMYNRATEKLNLTGCRGTVATSTGQTSAEKSQSTQSSSKARKFSLFSTSLFNLTSRKNSDFSTSDSNSKSAPQKSSTALSGGLKSTAGPSKYSNDGVSTIVSETQSHQSQHTKDKNIKKVINDESNVASDDSIFQSFAIDAKSDRLFLSVMENIDEEIIEEYTNETETNIKGGSST